MRHGSGDFELAVQKAWECIVVTERPFWECSSAVQWAQTKAPTHGQHSAAALRTAAATLLLGASHKPWAQLLEGGEGDLVCREALTEERVQRRLLGVDDECLRRLVQPNAKAPSHGITLGWATSTLAVI